MEDGVPGTLLQVPPAIAKALPQDQGPQGQGEKTKSFLVGERVEAIWRSDGEKYPGRVLHVFPNGTYEVLFDDGVKTRRKPHQIFRPEEEEGEEEAPSLLVEEDCRSRAPLPLKKLPLNPPSLLPATTTPTPTTNGNSVPKPPPLIDGRRRSSLEGPLGSRPPSLTPKPPSPPKKNGDTNTNSSHNSHRGYMYVQEPHYSVFDPPPKDLGKRQRKVQNYSLLAKGRKGRKGRTLNTNSTNGEGECQWEGSEDGTPSESSRCSSPVDSPLPGGVVAVPVPVPVPSPGDGVLKEKVPPVFQRKRRFLKSPPGVMGGKRGRKGEELIQALREDEEPKSLEVKKEALKSPKKPPKTLSVEEPLKPPVKKSHKKKEPLPPPPEELSVPIPVEPLPPAAMKEEAADPVPDPPPVEIPPPPAASTQAALPFQKRKRQREPILLLPPPGPAFPGGGGTLDDPPSKRIRKPSLRFSPDEGFVDIYGRRQGARSSIVSSIPPPDTPSPRGSRGGRREPLPPSTPTATPPAIIKVENCDNDKPPTPAAEEHWELPDIGGDFAVLVPNPPLTPAPPPPSHHPQVKGKRKGKKGLDKSLSLPPESPVLVNEKKKAKNLVQEEKEPVLQLRQTSRGRVIRPPPLKTEEPALLIDKVPKVLVEKLKCDKPLSLLKPDLLTATTPTPTSTSITTPLEEDTPTTDQTGAIDDEDKTLSSSYSDKPKPQQRRRRGRSRAMGLDYSHAMSILKRSRLQRQQQMKEQKPGDPYYQDQDQGEGPFTPPGDEGHLSLIADRISAVGRPPKRLGGGLLRGITRKRLKKIIESVRRRKTRRKRISTVHKLKDVRVDIINCICGRTDEFGLMVQCEVCLCWQHGNCFGFYESTEVPRFYVCQSCHSPKTLSQGAEEGARLETYKKGLLPTFPLSQSHPPFTSHSHTPSLKQQVIFKRTVDLARSVGAVMGAIRQNKLKELIALKEPEHRKLYQWSAPRPHPKDNVQKEYFGKFFTPVLRRLLMKNKGHEKEYLDKLSALVSSRLSIRKFTQAFDEVRSAISRKVGSRGLILLDKLASSEEKLEKVTNIKRKLDEDLEKLPENMRDFLLQQMMIKLGESTQGESLTQAQTFSKLSPLSQGKDLHAFLSKHFLEQDPEPETEEEEETESESENEEQVKVEDEEAEKEEVIRFNLEQLENDSETGSPEKVPLPLNPPVFPLGEGEESLSGDGWVEIRDKRKGGERTLLSLGEDLVKLVIPKGRALVPQVRSGGPYYHGGESEESEGTTLSGDTTISVEDSEGGEEFWYNPISTVNQELKKFLLHDDPLTPPPEVGGEDDPPYSPKNPEKETLKDLQKDWEDDLDFHLNADLQLGLDLLSSGDESEGTDEGSSSEDEGDENEGEEPLALTEDKILSEEDIDKPEWVKALTGESLPEEERESDEEYKPEEGDLSPSITQGEGEKPHPQQYYILAFDKPLSTVTADSDKPLSSTADSVKIRLSLDGDLKRVLPKRGRVLPGNVIQLLSTKDEKSPLLPPEEAGPLCPSCASTGDWGTLKASFESSEEPLSRLCDEIKRMKTLGKEALDTKMAFPPLPLPLPPAVEGDRALKEEEKALCNDKDKTLSSLSSSKNGVRAWRPCLKCRVDNKPLQQSPEEGQSTPDPEKVVGDMRALTFTLRSLLLSPSPGAGGVALIAQRKRAERKGREVGVTITKEKMKKRLRIAKPAAYLERSKEEFQDALMPYASHFISRFTRGREERERAKRGWVEGAGRALLSARKRLKALYSTPTPTPTPGDMTATTPMTTPITTPPEEEEEKFYSALDNLRKAFDIALTKKEIRARREQRGHSLSTCENSNKEEKVGEISPGENTQNTPEEKSSVPISEPAVSEPPKTVVSENLEKVPEEKPESAVSEESAVCIEKSAVPVPEENPAVPDVEKAPEAAIGQALALFQNYPIQIEEVKAILGMSGESGGDGNNPSMSMNGESSAVQSAAQSADMMEDLRLLEENLVGELDLINPASMGTTSLSSFVAPRGGNDNGGVTGGDDLLLSLEDPMFQEPPSATPTTSSGIVEDGEKPCCSRSMTTITDSNRKFSIPGPTQMAAPSLAKLTPEMCRGFLWEDIRAHQQIIDGHLDKLESELIELQRRRGTGLKDNDDQKHFEMLVANIAILSENSGILTKLSSEGAALFDDLPPDPYPDLEDDHEFFMDFEEPLFSKGHTPKIKTPKGSKKLSNTPKSPKKWSKKKH